LGEGPLIPTQSIARRLVSVDDVGGILPSLSFNLHDLHFQSPKKEIIEYFAQRYDKVSNEEQAELIEKDKILWFQDCIFVPASLQTRIMQLFHKAPSVGHAGIARTLALITRSFPWPGIRKDVICYFKSCDSCQRVKARRQNPKGNLQSSPVPHRPWSVIGMDFITKLPVSGGYDSIMVVIDKVTHFVPCKETYTAEQLAQLFRAQLDFCE
jgi:hypothetical protein